MNDEETAKEIEDLLISFSPTQKVSILKAMFKSYKDIHGIDLLEMVNSAEI